MDEPIRIIVVNGASREFASYLAAIRSLLPLLENAELQSLKLTGIHAEQMRRTVGLPDPGTVGAKAIHSVPHATEITR